MITDRKFELKINKKARVISAPEANPIFDVQRAKASVKFIVVSIVEICKNCSLRSPMGFGKKCSYIIRGAAPQSGLVGRLSVPGSSQKSRPPPLKTGRR
jgi:hypothetical protein